ncbi:MAG: MFS transporter [Bacteroidales bacterium]|nr:MFS transporter [Bacteroidales bacterium]
MFKNSKHYPILVVALLWVVALLNYMDRQMLSTMQSSICTDIVELQEAEAFGALMAIFLWIYGFMSPVAGLIADRLSRKWLVVASLFVWSAVTFLMGYAENFNQLYWLRAIMGVSEALYIPSALSLIADWHEGKSRSLAIGVHTTGLYIGQAIGGFGATAATFFSWQGTFQGFGMVGIVYSLILILLLHENPKHDIRSATASKNGTTGFAAGDILKSLALVFSNFAFWVILIYFAVPSLPGWATKNWLPTLFAESLNIPMSEAGPISTITIAASSFVGVLFGGYLSDRWVQRNIRGRIYTGAIGLGLTIPALCLLGMGHDLFSVVSAVLLFGIGFGMFDANNMPILCQFIAAKYRATAYGIMNMVGVFFGAAVTQVLGRWTDAGNLGSGFVLLGGAVAVALILQLACLKPQTDNKE